MSNSKQSCPIEHRGDDTAHRPSLGSSGSWQQSPFQRHAHMMRSNGLSIGPVGPGTKFFGRFSSGRWVSGLPGWQRLCEEQCTDSQFAEWCRWPDAGIAVACGPASQGLVAFDIDSDDVVVQAAVAGNLPDGLIGKAGAKGLTLFGRSNNDISAEKLAGDDGRYLCEVLSTGNLCVLPGTIHPDTKQPYRWLNDARTFLNSHVSELPLITPEHVEAIRVALEPFGYTPAPSEKPREWSFPPVQIAEFTPAFSLDEERWYSNTNLMAKANLRGWVDELGLYRGLWKRDGAYSAVPTFRPSRTHRSTERRKSNLTIHPTFGVTDWGDGPRRYTCLDLVFTVKGLELHDASMWLRKRVDPHYHWYDPDRWKELVEEMKKHV